MQCTFCGTENRPEYKFCGMCGVRMDRRQTERRTRPGGMSVKCASCGHMGEPGLKFCGMCGARIERRLQDRRTGSAEPVRGASVDPVRAAAIANAQLPTPEASKTTRMERSSPAASATVDLPPAGVRRGEPAIFQEERRHEEPRRVEPRRSAPAMEQPISGPSFLGLNARPEGEGDGEYLLEDEPSRGGLRKLILLVILIAILGLIFVQWRSSFKANPKPPPSKAEPASTPAGENHAPAADLPKADSSKDASTAANVSDGPPSASDPDSADAKAKAENPIAAVVPSAAVAPASAPPETAAENSDTDAHGTTDSKAAAAADTHLSDTKPSAALLRAQQFLQGRGVPQSCEQGMIYLKAATDKGDPGAAVQMAALYSSGHCVKQDRVMAYRWFNSAHELEPANMWIQKNMDQLWSQMTPQERRLAGY